MINIFTCNDIFKKICDLESACEEALNGKSIIIPDIPSREPTIEILPPQLHPPNKGLSYSEGKARLIHDLANIELQAMELALRTLYEFPEAPIQFREELYALTISEGKHFKCCIDTLNDLGYQWGFRPVHIQLWSAVNSEDSLLDRILIVHRYLEGSGLDAGEKMIRRLEGVLDSQANTVSSLLKYIQKEELDHVRFGSFWYQTLCKNSGIDPDIDFEKRLDKLKYRLPKRLEKINTTLRTQAGFTTKELETIEHFRSRSIKTY